MNKALLILLAVLAIAGCSKTEEEDATPAPSTQKAVTPVATPKSGDWMWSNPNGTPKGTAKGTPKAVNPLSISDDPFAPKTKK